MIYLYALLLQVFDISFFFVHVFGYQLIGNNFFHFVLYKYLDIRLQYIVITQDAT